MSDTGVKEQLPLIQSYLDVERAKLKAEADRRIDGLTNQQLAAVSLWLEADALTMMNELPDLDDALENVKMRGAISHGKQLAAMLRSKATERYQRAMQEQARREEENRGPESEPEPELESELPRFIPGDRYPVE